MAGGAFRLADLLGRGEVDALAEVPGHDGVAVSADVGDLPDPGGYGAVHSVAGGAVRGKGRVLPRDLPRQDLSVDPVLEVLQLVRGDAVRFHIPRVRMAFPAHPRDVRVVHGRVRVRFPSNVVLAVAGGAHRHPGVVLLEQEPAVLAHLVLGELVGPQVVLPHPGDVRMAAGAELRDLLHRRFPEETVPGIHPFLGGKGRVPAVAGHAGNPRRPVHAPEVLLGRSAELAPEPVVAGEALVDPLLAESGGCDQRKEEGHGCRRLPESGPCGVFRRDQEK